MVKYITKDEIGQMVYQLHMDSDETWQDNPIPILAFDNDTWNERCDECASGATHFKYNIAEASGGDSVIFDWNVDLERLYLLGYVCSDCGVAEIHLHEESPDNPGELIFERS